MEPDVMAEAQLAAEVLLRGELVTLRALRPEDASITLKWRLSPRAQYLQRGSLTVDEQRAWILSQATGNQRNFIAEVDGAPVGMIALVDIDRRNGRAVIGRVLIGEPCPKATFFEAEMLLLDYAFGVLHLHKVASEAMAQNTGMVRTRLSLGYHQDGILRDHFLVDGKRRDAVVVSIIEDEYRQVCRPKLVSFFRLFERHSGRR